MTKNLVSIPHGSDSVEIAVKDGVATIANQRGFIGVGHDGSNYQFIKTDTSGQQVTVGAGVAGAPAGGVSTVQGVAGGIQIPVSLHDGTGRCVSLDAFSRLRVSSPYTIFDSKQVFDDGPLFFETNLTTGGTATYVKAKAATELKTTTASGSAAIRQTKRYFNYQPGKSHQILATFNMLGAKTNVRKRVGYFDVNDGLFLELDGTAVSLVRRTSTTGSPVDNKVLQSAWSIDPMDGTGPSGVTLDFSKTQILMIDLEWLGVGAVRFGFNVDGRAIYVHEELNANNLTEVYMQTPNLPVRWEIENTGVATGTPQLDAICCTVMAEGGVEQTGLTRSANTGTGTTTIGATILPLISIRLKTSHIRATVHLQKATAASSTAANFFWQVIYNPTITGGAAASWTSVSEAVESDTSRTGTVTGGIVVDSGYVTNNNDQILVSLHNVLTLSADFGGTPDEVVLAVGKVGGGTDEFMGALTWLEAT